MSFTHVNCPCWGLGLLGCSPSRLLSAPSATAVTPYGELHESATAVDQDAGQDPCPSCVGSRWFLLGAVRRGFPGDPMCLPAKVKIRLVERAQRRIDVRRSKKLLLASAGAGVVLGSAPAGGGGVIIGRHHTCSRETSSVLTLPTGSVTWTDRPLCSCKSGRLFAMGCQPQGFPS